MIVSEMPSREGAVPRNIHSSFHTGEIDQQFWSKLSHMVAMHMTKSGYIFYPLLDRIHRASGFVSLTTSQSQLNCLMFADEPMGG